MVLTAKQAPHRPGIASALGLRADGGAALILSQTGSNGRFSMSIFSWLRRPTAAGRRAKSQANSQFKPILELLEVRSVLSATLVADIWPGAESSNPSAMASVDGNLIFSAYDGTNACAVWKSDGTAAGTT